MSVNVVFRKSRNRYQVDYVLDGKRHRPLFDSKQEADSFARRLRLGLSPEDKSSITIDEAGKKYFESVSQKKHPKSKSNDMRYINLQFHFLTYERGIERLATVGLDDMEAFRDWLLVQREYDDKPMNMGPSSINRCLRVMKHFYKKHVQWKNLKESPCVYLDFLDVEENERRAMASEEYELALSKAPKWFRPAMQFMFETGAPPSCVERFQWADADLVNRSYTLLRKKGRKAKWKRVRLPMTDAVFALLVNLRNESHGMGSVFLNSQGEPLTADRVCKVGNHAIKAAGIKEVTLYCMRHALASDMTKAGVATEIVRQAMGHESIATTQRYANKIGLKTIVGALESVRGAKVGANE